MMILAVRMINTERVFGSRYVVSQYQIQFITSITHSCDRCNGVMRNTFCFTEYEGVFISIISPAPKDHIGSIGKPLHIL